MMLAEQRNTERDDMSRSALRIICRIPRAVARRARKYCLISWRYCTFLFRNARLFRVQKILYALTPPAGLPNVGDHAQAIAIHRWLGKHFPELPVVEVDKNESTWLMPVLRRFVNPEDIIFLHSGGNLGDRGLWSERARRAIIASFPANQIVSLPQTIYFSDTPKGREERQRTVEIYARHPRLTVIARDRRSGEIAAELFPNATTMTVPDFVLSLHSHVNESRNEPLRILLCLRLDNESSITELDRQRIAASLPYQTTRYDTTLPRPLRPRDREGELSRTLDVFQAHDAVVTDRYHGVIFAILCGKPTVVVPTVDHKLTSAMDWFRGLPQVRMVDSPGEIPEALEEVLGVESPAFVDWNALYFDRLPEHIGLARDSEAKGSRQ